MNWIDGLVSGSELNKVKNIRKASYFEEGIKKGLTQEYIDQGWELHKEYKTVNRVRRTKPIDVQFEDEVWVLLASLGFNIMNRDRNLKIPYTRENSNITQQIDIFAMDDETVLLVECKVSEKGRKGSFKTDIEKINGYRGGLIKEIKKAFPAKKNLKFKFVFATKNYEISEQDLERMKCLKIQYLDHQTIAYYSELATHLGIAARFQFLGRLFEGQSIGALDNRIPAIKGEMGGTTYYSFTIEPEKLLKISYVLHRTDANSELIPTYQRVIKKNRLKDIQAFIDRGGFFPNSIVISIDTQNRSLRFDAAPKELKGDNDRTRIGILHLPQRYRSAYIIDGQHRLYGYSDSIYSDRNSIPVIAFENLPKEKQVELFMQINENQKSVPKNLRNTLNADLLWVDENLNNQRKALRLKIAIQLGEKPGSPFYGCIRIGENESKQSHLITIETIQGGLSQTDFLSIFNRNNQIQRNGTFDKGELESTFRNVYQFIEGCFVFIKEHLSDEWDIQNDRKVLTTNNSIFAIIRLLNDIVNHIVETDGLHLPIDNIEDIIEGTERYLNPLLIYYRAISDDERAVIKTSYGSGAKSKVWRIYQKVVHDALGDFNPEGLAEWIDDNSMENHIEAIKYVTEIEAKLKKDIRNKLQEYYGDKWTTQGIPKKVYASALSLAADKDYEKEMPPGTTQLWDCLTLINYREIIQHSSNWSVLFDKVYTRPEEQKISGGKDAKTKWLVKLNDIRNLTHHNNPVNPAEFAYLEELHKWLVKSE